MGAQRANPQIHKRSIAQAYNQFRNSPFLSFQSKEVLAL